MNKIRLDEIAAIKMGQSPQGTYCNNLGEGTPLLNGPSEFNEFYPIPVQYTTEVKRLCEKGEILFCVRGSTTGRMNWADREYALGRGLASISHKLGKEYNHFLKYLIQTNLDSILKLTSGSTFPNLTGDMLNSFEFVIPEKHIQKQISKFLLQLDSKIALNNRINAELEAMAKTVYDYWFVQFDFPFDFAQGKPSAEGKPYKSSGGKMVWSEELKIEVPEGWGLKSLGDYADIRRGELITAKDTEQGNIKVVAAGIDYSYTHSKSNKDSNTITISGSGANAGYINFWREPIFASDCITVRANSDTETLILLQFLKAHQIHILNQAKGSAQPHVYPSDIKILNYPIAPKELLDLYGDIVIPLNNRIANNQQENQQLSSLRDWLLPMLMNGQVKVGEVEAEVLRAAEPGAEYRK